MTVRKKNKAVMRKNLQELKQDQGEAVRKFTGRVRTLAKVCGFVKTCGCGCDKTVDFTEETIKDRVIAGLYSSEIQKDILSMENCEELSLEKILKITEGKEAGEIDASSISSNRVNRVKSKLTSLKKFVPRNDKKEDNNGRGNLLL